MHNLRRASNLLAGLQEFLEKRKSNSSSCCGDNLAIQGPGHSSGWGKAYGMAQARHHRILTTQSRRAPLNTGSFLRTKWYTRSRLHITSSFCKFSHGQTCYNLAGAYSAGAYSRRKRGRSDNKNRLIACPAKQYCTVSYVRR
jgi:hypothetical protein